ncbi:MAG TPA: fatty acid hydroxylase, partial [Opitutae bacterium]|nr:fatty acid hydroxylase [Opitutae bacterium]
MTELTITDVYAFGVPIILALILLEVLISNLQNK